MTKRYLYRARQLIADYGLHSTTPVKLWKMEDIYPIRYENLSSAGIWGMILEPLSGWGSGPARVVMHDALGPEDARIVYAHEIGHGVCQHAGALPAALLGLSDRHERQAWAVAATLLIPHRIVMEEREIDRIAEVCMVPEWLVEIWQSTNG